MLLSGSSITAAAGADAVIEAASRPADLIVASISGAAGLAPTMAAIERGTAVAIANKECLVCAGALFMRRAAEKGATILPVDSEHNALFQAMAAGRRSDVRRLILTASGGPFRTWSAEAVSNATPEQALKHPNWSMGAKVTIDSATLMNKGLELIEAHHLFQMPAQRHRRVRASAIDRARHRRIPGRIVHRATRRAGYANPDLALPGLARSHRMNRRGDCGSSEMASLTFEAPDLVRFPALRLARTALEEGGAAPTVLNACQ